MEVLTAQALLRMGGYLTSYSYNIFVVPMRNLGMVLPRSFRRKETDVRNKLVRYVSNPRRNWVQGAQIEVTSMKIPSHTEGAFFECQSVN